MLSCFSGYIYLFIECNLLQLESKRAAQPMGGSPFIPNDPPVALVFFVADEYDPLRPNEYEEFSKRRKKERDNQRRREAEER